MAATQPLPDHESIQLLIATHKEILGRFAGFLELIASNQSDASAPTPLQGKAAEVLRLVAEGTGKAIEQLLVVQGQLQVASIEAISRSGVDAPSSEAPSS